MARILVCTRGEDILGELGSLLNEGHPLVVVPSVADATCSLLLGHFGAVVLDLDEETPQRLEALPILGRLNRLALAVRRPRRVGSGALRLPAEAERHPAARIA
jgi:hypothetical protein